MKDQNANENKLKHLELIQGVISRMGGNLFTLRGWMITLIVGLSALFLEFGGFELQIILIIVVFIFWVHDGYFLAMERRYRDLYNKVRKMNNDDIDFSMDIKEFEGYSKNTVLYCMFSKTIAFFYIPTLILILLVNIL